jgi:hypothetical protein
MKTNVTNTTAHGAVLLTSTATHIVLSEEDRQNVERMIGALKASLGGESSDALVRDVVEKLASTPGADSAESLRPLVKCFPAAVAARLPEILEADGALAKTAVLSYVGKDVMFRMETAIAYGKAFLALTDLDCDSARQLRGY